MFKLDIRNVIGHGHFERASFEPARYRKFAMALSFVACLTLLGCTVSVKDHGNGENSKVDIETPIGGIHVNEEADVHDTGLVAYPGAHQKTKTDGESKSANVNISSGLFGVKVVAIEYESDDPPGKVLAFYRQQMKKFGNVVECHTDKHDGNVVARGGDRDSRPVSCEGENSGNVVELKTGTEDNEHLVSVEPQGKGSDFALVYIRTRGKQADI
jgi:hypothetical protein